MDLTQPVSFNGVTAQPITLTAGVAAHGIVLVGADYGPVPIGGNVDKIALGDGATISDTYLGGRTLTLRASCYGTSAGDCWDLVEEWLAAFSPRSPSLDSTAPLYFSQPTADTATWATGRIPMYFTAAPSRQPWHDAVATEDSATGSHILTVYAQLLCPDPYKYVNDNRISTNLGTSATTLAYRGNAPAKANVDIWVRLSATPGPVFTVTINGVQPIGDSTIRIDTSSLSASQTYVVSLANGNCTLGGTVVTGVLASTNIYGAITPGATANYAIVSGAAGNLSYAQLKYPEVWF